MKEDQIKLKQNRSDFSVSYVPISDQALMAVQTSAEKAMTQICTIDIGDRHWKS